MEYVQTVLVQIEAAKMSRAMAPDGLLPELDEHRSYLGQQDGFLDMRVTRSVNAEGNVLLVVETRWRNDETLVEYETREPNVGNIIARHRDVIVPDTLQVLDMEALRTESWTGPERSAAEVRERLALPLLVPMGVLAFMLLVIYGLSRVYLEISNEVATGLAAGIAVGILAIAWLLAVSPAVRGWHVGSIVVLASGALLGGAIFAVVQDEGGETAAVTEPGIETPAASPGESPGESPAPPAAGELALLMGDNFFEFEGTQNPTITVPVGQEVTISLTNGGVALHNMHVAGPGNEFADAICTTGGDAPCSDPDVMGPGESGAITFQVDQPGSYSFRCDFHPIEMTGTLEVS